jgi:hypothetical protein
VFDPRCAHLVSGPDVSHHVSHLLGRRSPVPMYQASSTDTLEGMSNILIPLLWIFTGTANALAGAAFLFIGIDQESEFLVLIAWPVLYVAGLAVAVGTIAAGIAVARK